MLKHVLIIGIVLTCATAGADYLEERTAAQALRHDRKAEEALAAFRELARMEGISNFQKSDALDQAAHTARGLKKYEMAEELAQQIPIESVAKTVQMQNLAHQRKYQALIDRFGDSDIDSWPEWTAGDAYRARGRAYYELGNGSAAEPDLTKAARLMMHDTSEAAAQLWAMLANNRVKHLDDEAGALEAYRRVVGILRKRGGGAGRLRGVLQAAAFLRTQGRAEEALEAVRLLRPHARKGVWGGKALCSLGATLVQLGRTDEALAAYREVLADDTVHSSSKNSAERAIVKLEGSGERADE